MTQGRNPPYGLYRQRRWSSLRHQHQNGTHEREWKAKSSRTGGISPTVVVEPPPHLPTAGGGGGDANRGGGGGGNEDIRRTAPICRGGGVLSGIGDRTVHTIWMKDHVQRNRRNQSDGSCRTPPPPLLKCGGGGDVHGGSGGSQVDLDGR